jgi:hypothetical protein
MEAQFVSDLCHRGVEHDFAGETKDVVGAVVLRPVHCLDLAVVAVAAPDNLGVWPMSIQTFGQVLDDCPHLGALGGARRAQNRYYGEGRSPRDRCTSTRKPRSS